MMPFAIKKRLFNQSMTTSRLKHLIMLSNFCSQESSEKRPGSKVNALRSWAETFVSFLRRGQKWQKGLRSTGALTARKREISLNACLRNAEELFYPTLLFLKKVIWLWLKSIQHGAVVIARPGLSYGPALHLR